MTKIKRKFEEDDVDVYRKLQQHLDNLPIGYPVTESGVEIRILKHLFTPKEAGIALHLRLIPEPLKKIYRRVKKTGISIEELEETLDTMFKKGAIVHGRVMEGEEEIKYYANAFLAVGMYEYQLDRLEKQFVEDFEQYLEEAYIEEFTKTRINQVRTVPIEESVSSEKSVATYDNIRKIFENDELTGGFIAIMDCVCRKSKDIIGEPCKQSDIRETCFTLNRGARMSLDKGWSRRVSKNKALEILKKFENEGFIIQADNTQHPFFICNCCGCCCELITNLKRFDKPVEYIASN
ncbi:MAG: hypothetical protein EU539_02390, partial [Promethearchaeota archaeon]